MSLSSPTVIVIAIVIVNSHRHFVIFYVFIAEKWLVSVADCDFLRNFAN